MCLAIPAKVLEVSGKKAKVDFGGGIIRESNISLVNVKVGDYVIVHAGFAIQVIDEKDAMETLNIFQQILNDEEKYA